MSFESTGRSFSTPHHSLPGESNNKRNRTKEFKSLANFYLPSPLQHQLQTNPNRSSSFLLEAKSIFYQIQKLKTKTEGEVGRRELENISKSLIYLAKWNKENSDNEHSSLIIQHLQFQLVNITKQQQQQKQKNKEKIPIYKPNEQFSRSVNIPTAITLDIESEQQQQQLRKREFINQPTTITTVTSFHQVERTIHEIGGMFTDLTKLLKQQNDSLKRIDQDVEDFERNIQKGEFEIERFFKNLSNDRKLMICLFLILVFVLFLWIKFFK